MSHNIDIAAHLAANPLEEIMWNFHILYGACFDAPSKSVFDKPKDQTRSRNPIKALINQFLSYIKFSFVKPREAKVFYPRLNTIDNWMKSTTFDLAPFVPIATLILNNATDLEVWNSLMHLVDTLETHMAATDEELDVLASKSIYRRVVEVHEGTKQTMEELKKAMRTELSGSVFMNVIGFWEKYFGSSRMKKDCETLTQAFVDRSSEAKFKFPEVANEADVWKWMKAIEDDLFKSTPCSSDSQPKDETSSPPERSGHFFTGAQYHTLAAGQITGDRTDRQVDYFIKRRNQPIDDPHHWRDILVVGELTKSPSRVFREKFLQLSVYMREVFAAQPLRRFVHGFILFEKDLQLWVYDRSGPYSCSYIDIGKTPKTFVHVLATYMLMNDDEHGFDPNIKYQDNEMIVELKVPGMVELQKFTLHPEPIAQQKAYVSRGTSCYRAIDYSYVLKFSWGICGSITEVGLLQMVDNIPGMAKMIGSRDLVKISDLREGLSFTETMVKGTGPIEKAMATPLEFSGGSIMIPKESISNPLGRKRKSEALKSGIEMSSSCKKMRSVEGSTCVSRGISVNPLVSFAGIGKGHAFKASGNSKLHSSGNSYQTHHQTNREKRKTVENAEVNDRMKKIQLSSNAGVFTSKSNAGLSAIPEVEKNALATNAKVRGTGPNIDGGSGAQTVKMVNAKVMIPRDRQFTAVGISPYGRPISKFRSALELISGMNDAIKAHRLLLINANILHRDISINNILLTVSENPNEFGGVLIDLDLATLFNEGKDQKKVRAMTGTMAFMSLEILRGSFVKTGEVVTHTHEDDLESFFYVLIWVCISCGWKDDKTPHGDFLSKWYTGTAEDIHNTKELLMSEGKFEKEVLSRFSPKFNDIKELAEDFWIILFYRNASPSYGKSKNKYVMYEYIIAAFDARIQTLTLAQKQRDEKLKIPPNANP